MEMAILSKFTCSIKDYPTEIKVSNSKRAMYWTEDDYNAGRIPKKYSDSTKFQIKEETLVEISTGEKVIKNSKTAGKPRMLTINAQKIYVGIHHSVRSKIVNELHEIFNREFKKQLPTKIDLKGNNKILVTLHFYDTYTSKLPDLDNLANLFAKCGIDCLTTINNPNQMKSSSATHKLAILPDDKIEFIPHILYEFTDINDPKDRRLEFNLFLVTSDFSVESLLDQQLSKDGKSKESI